MSKVHDSTAANNQLLPPHLADLRKSGLSDEQIRACGFHSITDPRVVADRLGWKGGTDQLGPCLAIPFRDALGKPVGYVRLKPDRPRMKDGKPVKYESPLRAPNRVYFPPKTRAALPDVSVRLLITEGEKKAAKADQEGFPCIGLVGVYGFQKKRPKTDDGTATGPRELIPDLNAVAWSGRAATIVFDSDATEKPQVRWAEYHLAEALTAAGAVVDVVRLPAGPGGAKQGLDDYLAAHGPDELRKLLGAAKPVAKPRPDTPASNPTPPESKEEKSKESAADVLVRLATSGAVLWHDDKSETFASVGRLTVRVKSQSFRRWLIDQFYTLREKAPTAEQLANAVNTLDALAARRGALDTAHVRIAWHIGRVYVQLADDSYTVIEIGPDGWRECADPPVRFVSSPTAIRLPRPVPGGSLDDLRKLLGVPDDDQWALILAWLAGAMFPAGPFPILLLFGEQGSAKTTLARALKRLIDPSEALTRSEPKCLDDVMIATRSAWALVFDNLSRIEPWLSDTFCVLATGGSTSKRGLFTDAEEVVFTAKRPIILTSIEDVTTRGDLVERGLVFRRRAIPEDERVTEADFWARFDAILPGALGRLFDRVAGGLRALPHTRLERMPRMADFTRWAVACERGAGEAERFLTAYLGNQAEAQELPLDDSSLPAPILKLMENRDEWTGTPQALLDELGPHSPDANAKRWPRSPRGLTGQLKRLAPSFRAVHRLDIRTGERSPGGNRARQVVITRIAPKRDREDRPPPSRPSPDGETSCEISDSCGTVVGSGGTVGGASVPLIRPAITPEKPAVRDGGTERDDSPGHPSGRRVRRRIGNDPTRGLPGLGGAT